MKRILIAIGICACMGIQSVHAELSMDIPLFYFAVDVSNSCDDPGSSTIDPVDQNQLTAELKGNTLTVYEKLEGEVYIYVRNSSGPVVLQPVVFDQSISVELPEPSYYEIYMWHLVAGSVYGKFRYTEVPQKIIQNGQMSIRFNNCDYTPSGVKIY